MPPEMVSLWDAGERILAQDLAALRTQPPFPASAMDGYAVRHSDIQNVPCTLKQIGESAAGHGFDGAIGTGKCTRIFTGAPVPEGADTIIIQENVETDGSNITILQNEVMGKYVRPAGLDFSKGDILVNEGAALNGSTLALAASMNHAELPVRKKPVVAIIATGDELLPPGSKTGPGEIICSNNFGVFEMVRRAGGHPVDLGIAKDTFDSLDEKFEQARNADIVITLGGASVGEHDLVRQSLGQRGVELDFWKIAMRPGKPVMFGQLSVGERVQRYIGLPGNPVSSLVCTILFIVPLVSALLGVSTHIPKESAVLAADIPPNDVREEYMRARLKERDGQLFATPFPVQDSSMTAVLAQSDCLIIRPANAPQMASGSACTIIRL